MCTENFRQSFFVSATSGQEHAVPVVSGRVVWVCGDGCLEFIFRALPIPIVVELDIGQRGTRFGGAGVDL